MKDIYYVPDLKNNILSIGCLLKKECSIFMKDRILHLKNKNDRLNAHVKMMKNQMFKHLKIKAPSFKREGKVKDTK